MKLQIENNREPDFIGELFKKKLFIAYALK